MLSSGGYGPVVVDRSVAIIAPAGVHAGITVFTGAGITIATPGITVKLRGLTVGGQGGSNGVNYTAGERLIVEDCTFANLLNDGIRIEGEGLRGSISNSRFENITESGIHARNGAQISVDRGAFVGGNSGVSAYSDTGNVPSIVLVSDSHFEGMAGAIGGGVQLSGSAEVVATRNTILGPDRPVGVRGNSRQRIWHRTTAGRRHPCDRHREYNYENQLGNIWRCLDGPFRQQRHTQRQGRMDGRRRSHAAEQRP